MEITTETTAHIDTDELVEEIRSSVEYIAEEVFENISPDTSDLADRIEDAEYNIENMTRNYGYLRESVDRICDRIDELSDAIKEGSIDSEALRWQTIGVLGMIDQALRNSPDPAPTSADLPPNVW